MGGLFSSTPSQPSPDESSPSLRKASSRHFSKKTLKGSHADLSSELADGSGGGAGSPGRGSGEENDPASSPEPSSIHSGSGSGEREDDGAAASFVPTEATQEATQTLFRHYQEVMKSHPEKEGFRVELEKSNMYRWLIHLFDFPPDSQIAQDLTMYHAARPERSTVCLEAIFPPNYPKAPPFMRIVYPRFHQYTGHITIGGSICVKELTLSGWSSEFRLTQFAIMIRNLLMDGGALVDMTDPNADYSQRDAQEAFHRVAAQHGWKTK